MLCAPRRSSKRAAAIKRRRMGKKSVLALENRAARASGKRAALGRERGKRKIMAPSRAGISSLCAGKRHGRAPRSAGKNRRARAAVSGKIDGKKPERRRQSSPPPIPCSSLSLSLLRRPPPASPPPPPALQPVGKKQRAGRRRRGHRRQQRAGVVACNNRGKAAGAGPGVDKAEIGAGVAPRSFSPGAPYPLFPCSVILISACQSLN